MSKYAIISHKNCNDGKAAAYVFNMFRNFEIPFEDFYFLAHTGEVEYDLRELGLFEALKEKEELWVLDFSLPLDLIERLLKDYPNLYIREVDHHKTFKERSPEKTPGTTNMILKALRRNHETGEERAYDSDFRECYERVSRYEYRFNQNVCGAVLTFIYLTELEEGVRFSTDADIEEFIEEGSVPDWLLYIQDRDIWTWKHASSAPYTEAFFDETTDVKAFLEDQLWEERTEELVILGKSLLKRKQNQVEQLAQQAWGCSYRMPDGSVARGLMVNCNGFFTSDLCNCLLKNSVNIDFAIGVEYNGNYWKCGIRSLSAFDTTVISSALGGGGHKNASGFRMNTWKELEETFSF